MTISCRAVLGARCKGRIDLDLFGAAAGSSLFNIRAGKTGIVPVKLKPKIWTALQKNKQKRLKLN